MTHQSDNPMDYLYIVEKNIPLPEREHKGTPGEHTRLIYPFPFMEVGDSFFVPNDGLSFYRRSELILTSARSFNTRRCGTMVFATRRDHENNGVRCWRVK